MAISASSVFEVRFPGSDTNGGGFVTGASGTDYSLQDAKNTVGNNISTTDAAANGTTTITSATASFTSAIVGNIIYFAGGTGTITGTWREVKTLVSPTSITIDALIAASTGMTMNIGGALASTGQAIAIATVANIVIYVKYNASNFTITSSSTNVAGGCFAATNQKFVIGYDTTRTLINTDANRPTFQASGIATAVLFSATGNSTTFFRNLIVDGQGLTSIRGFALGGLLYAINCKAMACTNNGFNGGFAINCETTTCSTQPSFLCGAISCVAHDNTVTGFQVNGSRTMVNCLSYANTGASSHGFDSNGSFDGSWLNCTAYGNGGSGFTDTNNSGRMVVVGCISEGNTAFGFNVGTLVLYNCGTYNNTGGTVGSANSMNIGNITNSTGTFFVDAAGRNFALNSTTNQGALARATNTVMNTHPLALTVGYQDIGAAQHQDSGGGTVGGFIIG